MRAGIALAKASLASDGTRSNFIFDDYQDALAAWRYPDLTEHALYTARVIEHTIRTDMADEARVLLRFERAQQRLKEVIEMPNQDANRVIRALKDNGWRISGKLKKEFPRLEHALTALQVMEAVQSAFEDRECLPIVS